MTRKSGILRLLRLLVIIVFASLIIDFVATLVLAFYFLGPTFPSIRGQLADPFLRMFPFWLTASAILIIFWNVFDYVYERLAKSGLGKSLRSSRFAGWTYEVKYATRRLFDCALLLSIVLIVLLEFFFFDSFLLSNEGMPRLLFYTFLLMIVVSVRYYLLFSTLGTDGILYWLNRFLENLNESHGSGLNTLILDRLKYLRQALSIVSSSYPEDYSIDVKGICSESEEFAFLATENDVRMVISNLQEYRDEIGKDNLPGAWSSLLEAKQHFASYVGRAGILRRGLPLGTRILGTLKSEKFWVAVYSSIVVLTFLLNLTGLRFPS